VTQKLKNKISKPEKAENGSNSENHKEKRATIPLLRITTKVKHGAYSCNLSCSGGSGSTLTQIKS
jgi:hypothetical protein